MGRHAQGWKLEQRRGIYYVRFTHAKRQHLVSTGKTDPREATDEASRLYARIVSGGHARPASTRALITASLTELWAEWLASISGMLDVQTLKTYETIYIGKHWPAHYSSIREMCDEVARERYRQARLRLATAQTVKKETWVQDKFLRWCLKSRVIVAVPARLEWDKRTLGTRTGKQKTKSQNLAPDQVTDIIGALPGWREYGKRGSKKSYPIRARFVVAYETSLRPATLDELRWEDWNGKTMTIRDEADKVRFGRDVPLSEIAQQTLALVKAQMEARGLDVSPAARIFGKHTYTKPLNKAAKACGLRTASPYDFRHARATHLADAGGSLTGIGHLLGHKQATTTSRYIHASSRAAEETLARGLAFRTQNGSSETGWPTGFEPAPTGATIQRSTN
jgi:integrase